jgi:hypothetical protein
MEKKMMSTSRKMMMVTLRHCSQSTFFTRWYTSLAERALVLDVYDGSPALPYDCVFSSLQRLLR